MEVKDVAASFHKHVPPYVKKQLNVTLSQDDVWDQVKKLYDISDETTCPPDIVSSLLSQVKGSIASFVTVLLSLKEGHAEGEQIIPQYLIGDVMEGLKSEMEYNKLREKVIDFAEELFIYIERVFDYLYQFSVITGEEMTRLKNDSKRNPRDASRTLFKVLLATSPKKEPIKYLKAAFRDSGLWYLADELEVSYQDVEDELQKHGLRGSGSRSSSLFESVYPTPLTSTSGQKLGRQQKPMVTCDFREQFHRFCESGKIPVYRQRVAVVGPYGVGKTHLVKRLIQEKYVEENDVKTPGVKIYRHRCIVHKAGRSCWIRGKDNPEDQFVQNMAIGIQKPETFGDPVVMDRATSPESLTDVEERRGMMAKSVPTTADSGSYTFPDRAAAATPGDSGSHDSPVRTVDYFMNIDAKLLGKIEKITRGEPVDPEKQVTIWDFGGQDVYYTTHQTFLSEHIIYLLVFRLDVDLDKKIPVYRGEKTVKEFIMFWLSSIHMHTIGRLKEEDRSAIPYVLIIGTHKDMLGPQVNVKDIFDKLSECLNDKQVLKDHIYQYFAINNLAKDGAEFDEIKRTIEKLCGYSSDTKATVHEFPVSWIQLEMDLAKKSEEIPIITIEELCKMAQRVGLSDGELQDSFIPYHHRQGDILHFKVAGLENVVIIDPLWLADVFSAIMTPANSQPGCSYGDILKDELKRGVLKEGVFDEYLKEMKMTEKKTEIIQLMLHFDLMLEISQAVENPLPGSGKRRFVVPSMLVSNNNANDASSESDPQKYLLIAFPHIPFPTGLFHRLIIRLLRKYKAQRYENNIPVVGFDRASFRLEDEQSVLHLVVEDKAMKLLITNATESPPEPHIYSNAREAVEDELSTLREAYCPRMNFGYSIRVKNDGPNIPIKPQDVQSRSTICVCVENCDESVDLRPYRVWFSAEQETHEPQSLGEVGTITPGLSPNATNFVRVSHLVLRLGTRAIRSYFLQNVVVGDEGAVTQFLDKHNDDLQKLRKKKLIYPFQWKLLYPNTGQADVKLFDITLLMTLIRNLHPDKANVNWTWPKQNVTLSSYPQTTQDSINHILRLKSIRNELSHHSSGEVDDDTFQELWHLASTSVLALGGDAGEVQNVMRIEFCESDVDHFIREIKDLVEENKLHFDKRFDRHELRMFCSICAAFIAVVLAMYYIIEQKIKQPSLYS